MQVAMLYLVPTRDRTITYETRYNELFREIAWGNDHGFDAVWLTEHHFSNYGYTPSPLIMLAKAAEVAPNMALGTAILVLPLWDPVRLAEDVATLDVLSGGRVQLGIGRGYQEHEFLGMNKKLSDNRAAFEESVEVLLKAWTQPDFTHEGKHFSVPIPLTVMPRPTQRPYPPIWMATTSPESIRYAAKHGFHFMTGTFATPPELKAHREFISMCLEQNGRDQRDYEFEANRFVFCSTSKDEIDAATEETRWQIRVARNLGRGGAPVAGYNDAPPYDGEPDIETWKHRLIFGNPDQVIARFQELADLGISYVGAEFQFGGLNHEMTMKSLDLFAREVLPAVHNIQPNKNIQPTFSAPTEPQLRASGRLP